MLAENQKIMEKNTSKPSALLLDDAAEEAIEENCMKWGMPLVDIYKLSLKFYKGKIKIIRTSFPAEFK